MKKLSSIELGLLVVASMFLVAGTIWLAWPVDVGSVQFVRYRDPGPRRRTEVSTVINSKVYGAVAIVLGAGIYTLVLYRPNERIRRASPKPRGRTIPPSKSSETLDR